MKKMRVKVRGTEESFFCGSGLKEENRNYYRDSLRTCVPLLPYYQWKKVLSYSGNGVEPHHQQEAGNPPSPQQGHTLLKTMIWGEWRKKVTEKFLPISQKDTAPTWDQCWTSTEEPSQQKVSKEMQLSVKDRLDQGEIHSLSCRCKEKSLTEWEKNTLRKVL